MILSLFDGYTVIIAAALKIFDLIMNEVMKVIVVNPTQTGLWPIIENLMGPTGPITSIGRALVVIFFLAGWIAESVDPRQNMRLDEILKLFIKIIVSDYFVTNNLEFFKTIYSIATGIAGLVGTNNNSFYDIIPKSLGSQVMEVDGSGKLIMFVLSLIFFLIVVGSAITVLIEAYTRIIKVCLIIPFGALTMATMASGNSAFSSVSVQYIKYLIATLLEVFTMILAVKLTLLFFSCNQMNFNNENELIQAIMGLVAGAIGALTLASLIKGSKEITHRIIG